jgi:hypothetical protein
MRTVSQTDLLHVHDTNVSVCLCGDEHVPWWGIFVYFSRCYDAVNLLYPTAWQATFVHFTAAVRMTQQKGCIGLARTIYIRCIYGTFGRDIAKYTVIHSVYTRFWPTLAMHAS